MGQIVLQRRQRSVLSSNLNYQIILALLWASLNKLTMILYPLFRRPLPFISPDFTIYYSCPKKFVFVWSYDDNERHSYAIEIEVGFSINVRYKMEYYFGWLHVGRVISGSTAQYWLLSSREEDTIIKQDYEDSVDGR